MTVPTRVEELSVTDQLRRAIDRCGVSRYRLCKIVGMSTATMSRFMNRKGGLSVDMFDRLGRVLRLRLVTDHQVKNDKDG